MDTEDMEVEEFHRRRKGMWLQPPSMDRTAEASALMHQTDSQPLQCAEDHC